jgi:hypothetical protein
MIALWISVGIIILLTICIFAISYYCYRRIFYSPPRKKINDDEYEIPDGEIYEKYRDKMVEWMRKARQLPHEDCEIKSFDGLTLKGKYYQFKKDAPIEILFHGYRGNSERDLSGGVERCFKLGRNALIVDQRGCGESEGNVITFGINERLDCLNWINFAIEIRISSSCVETEAIILFIFSVSLSGFFDHSSASTLYNCPPMDST